jgi:hypothetical protein
VVSCRCLSSGATKKSAVDGNRNWVDPDVVSCRCAKLIMTVLSAGSLSAVGLVCGVKRAPRYTAWSSPTSVMIRDVCCVASGAKTRAVGVLPAS